MVCCRPLVGIGAGTLTVPYLVDGQMLMLNGVAVVRACGLPIEVAGIVGNTFLGENNMHLSDWNYYCSSTTTFINAIKKTQRKSLSTPHKILDDAI